jgi:predicted alpha-1,6-mannanase (GH76 family)
MMKGTRYFKVVFSVLVLLLLCLSCLRPEADVARPGQPTPTPPTFNWVAIADSATTSLNQRFWSGGKYYNNAAPADNQFHYWPQAHALDVLLDAYERENDAFLLTYMNDWFTGVKIKNGNTFINYYYDDMQWIAMAQLRAYHALQDEKWLTESTRLWDDIMLGWNDIQGGGIAWNKGQLGYKNTPANAPACILSARLYQTTNNAKYLDRALQIYTWLKNTLVDQASGLVYDGINQNGDGKLQTDPGWKFSYNQGTYIGAALELYKITGNTTFLNDALKTADFFINDAIMSPAGIMRTMDNGDGGLFNGIGIRYLVLLLQHPDVPAGKRDLYINYVRKNAENLWANGTNKTSVNFGTNWSAKPGTDGYLNPNLSGCMLMEAMAHLKARQFIK